MLFTLSPEGACTRVGFWRESRSENPRGGRVGAVDGGSPVTTTCLEFLTGDSHVRL